MAHSKSSKQWLKRQQEDRYVQLARQQGWRSRAVFKLEEIDQRYGLFAPDVRRVVDLGAAPGAWSQYAASRMSGQGVVFALDLLPVDPLPGIKVIQGDFTENAVLDQLVSRVDGAAVDLVMSDMAPNISGMRSIDQPRSMYLAELALDFAINHLVTGGCFVTKLFQGEGYDRYIQTVRQHFADMRTIKPRASRKESREMYLIAQNYGL